jgi:hypothetical protein
MDDEMEPAEPDIRRVAFMYVSELREVADVIEDCPELMLDDDPYDAARRLLTDLDALDCVDYRDL